VENGLISRANKMLTTYKKDYWTASGRGKAGKNGFLKPKLSGFLNPKNFLGFGFLIFYRSYLFS